MQMSMLFDPAPVSGPMVLDDILDLQFYRILNFAGLSLYEINEQFFRGFHRWLPIVCPRLIHEIMTANSSRLPADISLLLLAMCLTTVHPSSDGPSNHSIYPEDLFVTVRMLFVHVQAVICASTALVQAGLLISVYEYACGRPEAAYISMGTLVRMAETIGLNGDSRQNYISQETQWKLTALEERNLWWGIVVLER